MSCILKCVSILLLLTLLNAEFLEDEFLEREDGDSLIYLQTKVTIPTAERSCHSLRFVWTSTEMRYTMVKVEMTGFSIYGIDYPNGTYFAVEVEDSDTRQLVVTVLAYGLNISDVPSSVDSEMESRQYFSKDNSIGTCLDFD